MALVRTAAAAGLFFGTSGCSLFHSHPSTDPTVVEVAPPSATPAAPDTTVAKAAPAPRHEPPPVTAPPPSTPPKDEPRREPAPREPGNTGPILTVRMSPEEETRLQERLDDDVSRATEALGLLKGRSLNREQADNRSLAEDFLRSALAARANDLVRAGTLAEKARLLAEELKSQVVK